MNLGFTDERFYYITHKEHTLVQHSKIFDLLSGDIRYFEGISTAKDKKKSPAKVKPKSRSIIWCDVISQDVTKFYRQVQFWFCSSVLAYSVLGLVGNKYTKVILFLNGPSCGEIHLPLFIQRMERQSQQTGTLTVIWI